MEDTEDEHDEPSFWDSAPMIDEDEDGVDCSQEEPPEESSTSTTSLNYNGKKPKWWRQLSQRRATKSQRRAMAAMTAYMLPRVSHGEMLDWNKVFPTRREIWLELGCGQGENLLTMAQLYPNAGYVGCDIHKPGVGTILKRMQESIQSSKYWTGQNTYTPNKDPYATEVLNDTVIQHQKPTSANDSNVDTTTDNPYSNVRMHGGDGMKLLAFIPSSSISSLLVTFPDPWPKSSHAQYRLIQFHTVKDIYRVLTKKEHESTPPGRFFLATDHEEHYEWCTLVFEQVNQEAVAAARDCGDADPPRFRRVDPCPDRSTWLPAISKYEQKGWDEGRRTLLQCWEVWPAEQNCFPIMVPGET